MDIIPIMKPRESLLISIVVSGIVIGIVFVFLLSSYLTRNIIKQQTDFYVTLAGNFARNAANAIATKDIYSLKMFVKDMSKAEGALYALVVDDNCRVVAHSDPSYEGKLLSDDISACAIKSDKPLIQKTSYKGIETSDVAYPIDIMGARWGEIRIGFSAEDMNKKAAAVRGYIIGFGVFVVMAGSLYLFFFPNTVTMPIMRLTSRGIVGEEQRTFTRALTNIRVNCSVNDNPPVTCKMADISIGGVKLTCSEKLSVRRGDKVGLKFLLPQEGGEYLVGGTISWVGPGQKACGVKFDSINLVDRMKLADFINKTKTKHDFWIREKLDEIGESTTKH